jgi:ubiquinone/menaquinone biosynthesis C-methylase UbiE
MQADLFDLPFAPASFDHVFVCFVLEHLADPARAVALLRDVVRPGGTITVIEGDHGSAYFHPRSAAADAAIACLVDLQAARAATRSSAAASTRCWQRPGSPTSRSPHVSSTSTARGRT